MRYPKPHRFYDDQLRLMESRGLQYEDHKRAIAALKAIGYYRFSAYTYPFRQPNPAANVVAGSNRRLDQFVEGATVEDALKLYLFDEALRSSLFDCLQQIEVGLRVQIGYQLGKSGPFAHLDRSMLDAHACSELRSFGRDQGEQREAHDEWLTRFRRLQEEAKHEEYVKHFTLKYDGKIPIWVATEFMDFGSLTFLYSLLNHRDADKIADNLGLKDRGMVYKWLKALNVLRNHCAHGSRIWNRSTVYPPKRPPARLSDPRIHHLGSADADRIYFLAAICALFAIRLNPASNWPRAFRTKARKFPEPHGMTLENTMGFASGWESQPLWTYVPTITNP